VRVARFDRVILLHQGCGGLAHGCTVARFMRVFPAA
jgi:hypothetical protein